jgi:hypothetical protein
MRLLPVALLWGAASVGCASRLPDHLDEDTCTRYFITNIPDDPLLEKEHCTLCQIITENAERWDYVNDLASLCNGVPPHAMDWVRLLFFRWSSCSLLVRVLLLPLHPCRCAGWAPALGAHMSFCCGCSPHCTGLPLSHYIQPREALLLTLHAVACARMLVCLRTPACAGLRTVLVLAVLLLGSACTTRAACGFSVRTSSPGRAK